MACWNYKFFELQQWKGSLARKLENVIRKHGWLVGWSLQRENISDNGFDTWSILFQHSSWPSLNFITGIKTRVGRKRESPSAEIGADHSPALKVFRMRKNWISLFISLKLQNEKLKHEFVCVTNPKFKTANSSSSSSSSSITICSPSICKWLVWIALHRARELEKQVNKILQVFLHLYIELIRRTLHFFSFLFFSLKNQYCQL